MKKNNGKLSKQNPRDLNENRKKLKPRLVARNGKVQQRVIDEFEAKMMLSIYNILCAATGIGKTHLTIQELMVLMVVLKKFNLCRLLCFIAPEKGIISEYGLHKHIKKLRQNIQKKNPNCTVTTVFNPSKDKIQYYLKNRTEDEVILLIMTDSLFNSRADVLKLNIEKYGLKYRSFFVFDESHISASSKAENTERNNGNGNPDAKCIKFSNIEKILEVAWVLGLSATTVEEMYNEQFGSKKYKILNTPIKKDDVMLSVAGHNPPVFFDVPKSKPDVERLFLMLFRAINDHQEYVNTLAAAAKLPGWLIPKITHTYIQRRM